MATDMPLAAEIRPSSLPTTSVTGEIPQTQRKDNGAHRCPGTAGRGDFHPRTSHCLGGGQMRGPPRSATGRDLDAHKRRDDSMDRLTPREPEVISVMAEGLGTSSLGERLHITENAVQKHIRNIFAKLDLAPDDENDRRLAAVLRYPESI